MNNNITVQPVSELAEEDKKNRVMPAVSVIINGREITNWGDDVDAFDESHPAKLGFIAIKKDIKNA